MILDETYTLPNGITIPKLGAGVWMIDDETVEQVVLDALDVGYRHIDTAQAYRNEEGVGRGIQASGIDRKDIFVTTKLSGNIKDYEGARESIDKSLARLNLDYIDLMIIHSPQPWAEFRKTDNHYFEGNLEAWRALEEAYKAKKIRAIGVSNFEKIDLENLIENSEIKPMVNQILVHITNVPSELIKFCEEHGILVEAYSPIAHGAILDHPKVKEMADKYTVSPAQLSLRYVLQLGTVALPKSTNKDHMRTNADLDFTITAEDMEVLNALPLIEHYGKDHDMPVFKTFYED